jgi:hypothetical protein
MDYPECTLQQQGNEWVAHPIGKGAPILRPVDGNTRPSSAARWSTREAAIAELAQWGWVVRIGGFQVRTGPTRKTT